MYLDLFWYPHLWWLPLYTMPTALHVAYLHLRGSPTLTRRPLLLQAFVAPIFASFSTLPFWSVCKNVIVIRLQVLGKSEKGYNLKPFHQIRYRFRTLPVNTKCNWKCHQASQNTAQKIVVILFLIMVIIVCYVIHLIWIFC